MYAIKRTYGVHTDYLQYWDDEYGTACGGTDKNKAMHFTESEIDEAVERANRECCGANGAPKPDDMVFEKVRLSFK